MPKIKDILNWLNILFINILSIQDSHIRIIGLYAMLGRAVLRIVVYWYIAVTEITTKANNGTLCFILWE